MIRSNVAHCEDFFARFDGGFGLVDRTLLGLAVCDHVCKLSIRLPFGEGRLVAEKGAEFVLNSRVKIPWASAVAAEGNQRTKSNARSDTLLARSG